MRGLSLALGHSILRALHSNSRPRLPRIDLLIYLARPNSDAYITAEDAEIPERRQHHQRPTISLAGRSSTTGWAAASQLLSATDTQPPETFSTS